MFLQRAWLLLLILVIVCLYVFVRFTLNIRHPSFPRRHHYRPQATKSHLLPHDSTLPDSKRFSQTESPSTKAAAAAAAASAEMKTPAPKDLVNPHPFTYLINPVNACRTAQGGHVEMLVYIHSAPANWRKRLSIRQTWGARSVLQSYNATLVFVMGKVPQPWLMHLAMRESELFGDIMQEDFVDIYHNLTYKAVAALKWTATFCSRVTYILKTDDDILVNMPRFMQHVYDVVKPRYGSRRLVLCNKWVGMPIIRDPAAKMYVSEEEMKGDTYSPYCSGWAFLLSGDMARLLYEGSLVTPFFWVDDVYITGPLVQRLGIEHRVLNEAYFFGPGTAEDAFRQDVQHKLFFFHVSVKSMYSMWKNMTAVSGPSTARAFTATRSSHAFLDARVLRN